jgi:hypothetical protein
MAETTRGNGEQRLSTSSPSSGSASSTMAGMAGDVAHQAMEMGEKAAGAASEAGRMATGTMREYPIATAAVIAGVAFALGALWKSGTNNRRHPMWRNMNSYMDRINDTIADNVPRRWRY